jgi:hypothetical protein
MYMMPFDDSAAAAAAAVIGNRTMPIVDELADSNTIDFGYCCMYACVTRADLRCFDFGASISTLHTKLAGVSRSWDRWDLCHGDCGEDLPIGYQRFILGPLVSL